MTAAKPDRGPGFKSQPQPMHDRNAAGRKGKRASCWSRWNPAWLSPSKGAASQSPTNEVT
ncbi:MAG: hypothetical protein ACYCOR_20970 [Acidobacteriaceae bacterium]